MLCYVGQSSVLMVTRSLQYGCEWGVSGRDRGAFEKGEQKACVHSTWVGFFPWGMDKLRSAW